MKIIKLDKTNQGKIIEQTIKVLNDGGLVVFPSDTVYGLLCDATNPKAIDKLLAFKERPAGKAISVFVADEKMASNYVEINQNAKNIINNLLPGPFTVICSAGCHPAGSQGDTLKKIDPRLLAENGTLGFRIPDYPLILELVKQFDRPITATSANISSTPPHYSIESFLGSAGCHPAGLQGDTLMKTNKKFALLDLIVDAGKLPRNKPSTVIDTTTGQLKTLRLGDLLPKTPNSLISKSEKDTKALAGFILTKALKKSLGKPIVFLLEGELGAGKTIFTKGLGKALKIKDEIVSPTYTICYEYKVPMSFQKHEVLSGIYGIHIDSRFRGNDIETHGQSTRIDHLSTDSPIKNQYSSDTERQDPNTNFVEQDSIFCHSGLDPESIKIDTAVSSQRILGTINNYIDSRFRGNDIRLLVHYDLYRIETREELEEIGFLESIIPGNIYAVEWPERLDPQTISKLKKAAQVTFVKIKHLNEKERPPSHKASARQREIEWSN